MTKTISLKLYVLIAAISTLAACSDSQKNSAGNSTSTSGDAETTDLGLRNQTITVKNEEGSPVQAGILIGERQGSPFSGNWIQTSPAGTARIPGDWKNAQSVTIDAPGYVRLTLLEQKPGNLQIQLRRLKTPQFELSGMTTGYTTKDFDNRVDFGLLFPAIEKKELLTFTPDLVISPETDQLSVVGKKMNLPSNVALPKQKESYYLTITLDKPRYKMFFQDAGMKNVFLARGHFPMKEVVGEFQNDKEVFELINYFNITGGQLRQVNVNGAKTNFDMNASEMTFSQKLDFQAPAVSSSEALLVVSAADLGGTYLPSDIKRLNAGETAKLNLFSDKQNVLLGILKNKNEFSQKKPGADRFSAHLMANLASNLSFLPLIPNPTVVNPQSFRFDVPRSSNLKPLAMTVQLSSLKPKTTAGGEVIFAANSEVTAQARWEIRSMNWTSNIALPDVPARENLLDDGDTTSDQGSFAVTQRVQVSFVASTSTVEAQSWNDVISKATHITHASQDY